MSGAATARRYISENLNHIFKGCRFIIIVITIFFVPFLCICVVFAFLVLGS
jgi:hypothetical protein